MVLITGYIPPYKPLTNITPFTYRDGQTYLDILERLRAYVNDELVKFINENFTSLGDSFELEVNKLIADVNTALDTQSAEISSALAAQTIDNNTAIANLTDFVNDSIASIINSTIDVSDPVIEAVISDSLTATRQYLDSIYDRQFFIDANKNGVVADGVTDDTAAWNAIVASAPENAVITFTGKSILYNSIIWKSKLSLVGKGRGKSILATADTGVQNVNAAIRYVEGDGAGIISPLEDCTFANFEIDGSLVSGTDYLISAKGIFTLYHKRCQWINLYIHDTQATGLGSDFMQDCLISGVVAVNCGRNNPGNAGGGAGIGIGTGAWEYEPLTIVGCSTRDCGNWGIFVEWQETQPFRGTGSRIIGNTSINDRIGIGDRGTRGTLIANNVVEGSNSSGIDISFGAIDTIVSNNHVYNATGRGIFVQQNSQHTTVKDNIVNNSGNHGIAVDGASVANPSISIEGNKCYENANCGIYASSTATGRVDNFSIKNNKCWNNGQVGGAFIQGIRVETNSDIIDISGNSCFDNQTVKTQNIGISLGASALLTLSNGRISENICIGNSSAAQISLSAITRTNIQIKNNIGYVTENMGTATIADGASTVVVTHGLATIPTIANIVPKAAGTFWISAKGSTTFTISRTGTTGAVDIDWLAIFRP